MSSKGSQSPPLRWVAAHPALLLKLRKLLTLRNLLLKLKPEAQEPAAEPEKPAEAQEPAGDTSALVLLQGQ